MRVCVSERMYACVFTCEFVSVCMCPCFTRLQSVVEFDLCPSCDMPCFFMLFSSRFLFKEVEDSYVKKKILRVVVCC